jgi:hypothetical protein
VLRELRLAGLLRGPRRAAEVRWPPLARATSQPAWHEIVRAPLEQQPRLLLTLLAMRLTEQSRLAAARGMTARELTRAAWLPDEADRIRLSEVAWVAECLRFSDHTPAPENIAAALQRGWELLEHLEGGRADPRVSHPASGLGPARGGP